jgi:uncharacterized protein YjbJ (UPF0337 family)
MAGRKTKKGKLTEADLACYGIPPKQPISVNGGQPEISGDVAAIPKAVQQERRTLMKASTKDKAEGKIHEVKGKIKEAVGKVTNDPDLEVSGDAEKKAGKVRARQR